MGFTVLAVTAAQVCSQDSQLNNTSHVTYVRNTGASNQTKSKRNWNFCIF